LKICLVQAVFILVRASGMSVEITFEPAGLTGLVSEGSLLSDAARRMGLPMPLCKGKGDCTCFVTIVKGASLLSTTTESELSILGIEGLDKQQRLACQVKIERGGELVVELHTEEQEKRRQELNNPATMRKKFGELGLNEKIATLIQLEAVTMHEAMNALVDKPLALGAKAFDKFFGRTRSTRAQQREKDPS
jgi:ferredoxin